MVSPERYARHIGVKVGKHCLISTRYWSSEPYLISIGNNVQITDRVSFHTHGGVIVFAKNTLTLRCLEKL